MTEKEVTDDPARDDTIRSLAIAPRVRLEHIESAIVAIDKKLDIRFDVVEARLTNVERAQEGQASTAEFVSKAADLAVEATKKAAQLADEATKKAVTLADEAQKKATILAEDQSKLLTAVVAFEKRLDDYDKKFWTLAGVAAALIAVAGFIGHFV